VKRIVAVMISLLILGANPFFAEGEKMTIQKGSKVSFDYTLTVDGEVIDSSDGRSPLEYVHGSGEIIPGLSKELEGMASGEEKKVAVLPEDGYGTVNPKAFQEVSKDRFPEEVELKEGLTLEAKGPEGQAVPVRITEVKDEAVVVDFNHPLAGKSLTFDVKIVAVQ